MILLENKELIIDSNKKARLLRVKPEDISATLIQIIQELSDLSWLHTLEYSVVHESFKSRAQKTCDELKIKLLNPSNQEDLLSDAGEYIVSCLSKNALVKILDHKDIPLMELLGRKKTGNPGFDFYTETQEILVAGEAKYVKDSNAYNNSLKQINQFISENKHKDDIGLLFFVASQKSLENINNDVFSVCAAFSSTSIKTETLENNIKNNEEFQKALTYSNVYLVAVDMYE